jgi:hypothetical protein
MPEVDTNSIYFFVLKRLCARLGLVPIELANDHSLVQLPVYRQLLYRGHLKQSKKLLPDVFWNILLFFFLIETLLGMSCPFRKDKR